jgi:hypothetical protein
MRKKNTGHLGSPNRIISSTAGLALAATAAQYWTSRSLPLESESLSWVLLLLFLKYFRRSNEKLVILDLSLHHDIKPSTTASRWIVAAGLAVASVCASENNLPGFLLVRLTDVESRVLLGLIAGSLH